MNSKHLFNGNGYGHMGFYWVANGLALELKEECKAYRDLKDKLEEEALEAVKGFCIDIRECLSYACNEHDRLVRLYDPYTDCELLRYSKEIAQAIEDFEDTFDYF